MNLKKGIKRVVSNGISGAVIEFIFGNRIPDLRWPAYRFSVLKQGIRKSLISDIFFGFYEAAEVRMIHKYYSGKYDTIEFGSSMGIVTSHLASSITKGKKLIAVEANPNLIDTLTANVERHKVVGADFFPLNRAVGYRSSEVVLQLSSNTTETRVYAKAGQNSGGVTVPTIGLSEILRMHEIKEFALICDIEGTELELLQFDAQAFRDCREFIVELHPVEEGARLWTTDELRRAVEEQTGMIASESDGAVVYFTR